MSYMAIRNYIDVAENFLNKFEPECKSLSLFPAVSLVAGPTFILVSLAQVVSGTVVGVFAFIAHTVNGHNVEKLALSSYCFKHVKHGIQNIGIGILSVVVSTVILPIPPLWIVLMRGMGDEPREKNIYPLEIQCR